MPLFTPRRTALGAASLVALAALAAPSSAAAAHVTYQDYVVELTELNNSGVSGYGTLRYWMDENTLDVNITATGLDDGPHPMHIHGALNEDGTPRNSFAPDDSFDADGDGYVEVLEAVGAYGDVMRSLTLNAADTGTDASQFMVTTDGTLNYANTFDFDVHAITSPVTGTDYTLEQFMPLFLREIVIHGGNVPGDVGLNTPGEVNGAGGYVGILPVAAGEIAAVPIPGAALLFGTAGAAGFLARRRRKGQAPA